jgi:hypothetical protein
MQPTGALAATPVPITQRPAVRVPKGELLRVGARTGLLAGLVLALHLALIAEVAAHSTPVPGVRSGFWTPLTGVSTVILGHDALHGDFAIGPLALGLALLLALAAVVGVGGVAWLYACLGTGDAPWLAMALGVAYGLLVEVVVLQLIVNPLQSPNSVYDSLPSWAWWAGWGVYGAVLGLLTTRRLRVAP